MSCQLWHVKSSQLITYFCCEIFFFDRIYAVLTQNLFCCNLHCFVVIPVSSRFTHFLCGEKLRPKCCPWRKNDKYHVWSHYPFFLLQQTLFNIGLFILQDYLQTQIKKLTSVGCVIYSGCCCVQFSSKLNLSQIHWSCSPNSRWQLIRLQKDLYNS